MKDSTLKHSQDVEQSKRSRKTKTSNSVFILLIRIIRRRKEKKRGHKEITD